MEKQAEIKKLTIDLYRYGYKAQRTPKDGLYDLIKKLPKNLVMAEIGYWAGESAEIFLKSGKVNKFYAIDQYGTAPYFSVAEKLFDLRTQGYDVVKIRGNTSTVKLPDLDFVYIDDDHSLKAVSRDINWALARNHKFIGGHDYGEGYQNTVILAVDKLLGIPKTFKDKNWLVKL